MKTLWLILPFSLYAGTIARSGQVPFSQINCGGVQQGTRINLNQIAPGPNLCTLHDAAWTVINTRCTRCHGETGPPPDTLLTFEAIRSEVGNLDLRTRATMLQGGRRGPALKPGDVYGSLIFLFASRCQGCEMTTSMAPGPLPPLRDIRIAAESAGFAHVLADSNEDSVGMPPYWPLTEGELYALRDWILAGAP